MLAKLIDKLDRHLGYHKVSGKSKTDINMADIELLVDKMAEDNLISNGSQRTHSPTLISVPSSPVAGINGKSLNEWIEQRMEMIRVRHYYRQFECVAASYTEEDESLRVYPHLSSNWADMPI